MYDSAVVGEPRLDAEERARGEPRYRVGDKRALKGEKGSVSGFLTMQNYDIRGGMSYASIC